MVHSTYLQTFQPSEMKAAHCWLLLLLLALALALLTTAAADLPLVCIVIRTYYGHGTYGDSSLINLLHSLKQQSHSRWVAHHTPTSTCRSLGDCADSLLLPADGMRCCWSWTTGPSQTCATSCGMQTTSASKCSLSG